jgi:hypothetical protein
MSSNTDSGAVSNLSISLSNETNRAISADISLSTGISSVLISLSSETSRTISADISLSNRIIATFSTPINLSVAAISCTTLNPTSLLTSSIYTEKIQAITSSATNVYTLDASAGNLYKIPSPSDNYTIRITNFPSTALATNQYTFGLMHTRSSSSYCNNVQISSPTAAISSTLRHSGGATPTITTSATIILNTFTVVQLHHGTTPTTYVMYNCLTF